jgi:F-type H+-transporting ATPase subunit a
VNPLEAQIVGHLGPVPITRAVVTTWALLAALALVCIIATRRLSSRPGRWQTLLEVVIVWIEGQIRDVIRREPGRFLPLLGTLLVFLLVANLSSLIPGVTPPTARIETAAALVLIVFVAIRWYGIREIGLWRHLKSYAQPHPIALPLNIIGEITRTFALMIRLFGNVMSGHFLVVVIVALAGFLVPIPLMVLGAIIGVLQAYIFFILAAVFIGAGLGAVEQTSSGTAGEARRGRTTTTTQGES